MYYKQTPLKFDFPKKGKHSKEKTELRIPLYMP